MVIRGGRLGWRILGWWGKFGEKSCCMVMKEGGFAKHEGLGKRRIEGLPEMSIQILEA
jgi:hypothetical protein